MSYLTFLTHQTVPFINCITTTVQALYDATYNQYPKSQVKTQFSFPPFRYIGQFESGSDFLIQLSSLRVTDFYPANTIRSQYILQLPGNTPASQLKQHDIGGFQQQVCLPGCALFTLLSRASNFVYKPHKPETVSDYYEGLVQRLGQQYCRQQCVKLSSHTDFNELAISDLVNSFIH